MPSIAAMSTGGRTRWCLRVRLNVTPEMRANNKYGGRYDADVRANPSPSGAAKRKTN